MNNSKYYIGWDVGAWYCKTNEKGSCDAIVILDFNGELIGSIRKNLINEIQDSQSCIDFFEKIFEACGIKQFNKQASFIFSIDTPLGYSKKFVDLITNYNFEEKVSDTYRGNSYLFRKTEVFLTLKGFKPLSAINDMIGSHSTKGIHFLSKFGFKIESIGVWKKDNVIVIESYPAANKLEVIENNPSENNSLESKNKSKNNDIEDAYICAVIAKYFDQDPTLLYEPESDIWINEGWIWVLKKRMIFSLKSI
jgi:hypothetical protein